MRLVLIGGMFDPPHIGHLILAEEARDAVKADKVIFIPTGDHPFKEQAKHSSAVHRLAMLKLAIKDNPNFDISEIELHRSGISYSVDTIESLRCENPESELFFCIGADNASTFSSWHKPEQIVKLCKILVWNRNSIDYRDDPYSDSMTTIDTTTIDTSSSQIRQRIMNFQSVRYLVPKSVEEYIFQNHLYQGA